VIAIRPEQPGDAAAVREVHARAFGRPDEADLVDPAFYPRFGFVPARAPGLTSEPPFPDAAFMVAELTPGALRGRRGVVRYGGFGS
jgi:predicted N-acetyltransferase YhbS